MSDHEPLTPEELANLARLREGSTETPWAIWRDLDPQGFHTVGDAASYQAVLDHGQTEECNPTAHVYTEVDAELIVAAVNALPRLPALIKEQRAEALREAAEGFHEAVSRGAYDMAHVEAYLNDLADAHREKEGER